MNDRVLIEIYTQFNGYIEHKEHELSQLKQIIYVVKVTDSKFHHLVYLNSKKQDLTHYLNRKQNDGKLVVCITDNWRHKRGKEEGEIDH